MKGETILITGGTGSLGHALVDAIFSQQQPKRIVIYSRDELKQFHMRQRFETRAGRMSYVLGDIRDESRLVRAFEDVDVVIHAAALKQVPAAEFNPSEFIKTNILGAENVIAAALQTGVRRVVALSTDKAAAPINLYGATKLCSDKLFVAANNLCGERDLRFSVVRYGNVMGSRGSVIPFFLERRKTGVIPITHIDMTRFNITLTEACSLVLHATENGKGGEIFVPKIPSYRILDLAKAIAPSCQTEIVGVRAGEKIHEEMITESDSYSTVDLGSCYAILPGGLKKIRDRYLSTTEARAVAAGFKLNSGQNGEWLTVEDIRSLIRRHLDPGFTPV